VSGNKATDKFFDVFVQDTTPPSCSPTVSPTTLGVPANQMVAVTVTPHASDIADAAPTSSIIGVTSNQGGTPGVDWTVSGLFASLKCVAGRVYTLSVQTVDHSGNASAIKTVTCTAAPLPIGPRR